MQKKKSIYVIVLFVVGIGWYILAGPCGVARVVIAERAFYNYAEEWADDTIVALATSSRSSLPEQISNFQDTRRKAGKMSVPSCLEQAHENLLFGMDKTIDSLLSLSVGNGITSYVQRNVMRGNEIVFGSLMLIDEARKCMPFCLGK